MYLIGLNRTDDGERIGGRMVNGNNKWFSVTISADLIDNMMPMENNIAIWPFKPWSKEGERRNHLRTPLIDEENRSSLPSGSAMVRGPDPNSVHWP